jgi:uncharacterized protein (DUF1499 family)
MNKWHLYLLTCTLAVFGCAGKPSSNLGVTNGRLSPCPKSPNCVSSQSTEADHFIESLYYTGTKEKAKEILIALIQSMKRAKIVTITEDYIHAEFSSRIFRFVDDVEFLFDEQNKRVHLRSASRIGYSDLGVNRKRIETIRAKFINLGRRQHQD